MNAQDDVNLAKELVAKVIGDTVHWKGKDGMKKANLTRYTMAIDDAAHAEEADAEEVVEEAEHKWTISVAYTYPIILLDSRPYHWIQVQLIFARSFDHDRPYPVGQTSWHRATQSANKQ